MQNHTKIYLEETGLEPHEVLCEVCRQRAQDIHHLESRGMGSSKLLDIISNLMALCRYCHIKYGDKQQYMAFLTEIHIVYLKVKNVNYE